LSAEEAAAMLPALAELLIDAVDSGASLGFLPPLAVAEASEYWTKVVEALRGGSRILLVAERDGGIDGSVQLDLETRANGRHRAELMKLFVHRRARRLGLATVLIAEAEDAARAAGRTLLIADTRQGGEAERLLAKLGWVRYGAVPQYARSADGTLHTTIFFYKELR
jgi:acetyltransferase